MRLTYVHLMSFAATLGDRTPEVVEVSVTADDDRVTPDWAFIHAPAYEPAPKKRTDERSRQAAREMHRRGFRR